MLQPTAQAVAGFRAGKGVLHIGNASRDLWCLFVAGWLAGSGLSKCMPTYWANCVPAFCKLVRCSGGNTSPGTWTAGPMFTWPKAQWLGRPARCTQGCPVSMHNVHACDCSHMGKEESSLCL